MHITDHPHPTPPSTISDGDLLHECRAFGLIVRGHALRRRLGDSHTLAARAGVQVEAVVLIFRAGIFTASSLARILAAIDDAMHLGVDQIREMVLAARRGEVWVPADRRPPAYRQSLAARAIGGAL
jgi:hypothetical protein